MSLGFNDVVRILAGGKIPSPRLEARILFEYLGLNQFAPVDGEAEIRLRSLLERRLAHAPLDKILGKRDFYKNTFAVSIPAISVTAEPSITSNAPKGEMVLAMAHFRRLLKSLRNGCRQISPCLGYRQTQCRALRLG